MKYYLGMAALIGAISGAAIVLNDEQTDYDKYHQDKSQFNCEYHEIGDRTDEEMEALGC